MNNQLSVLIPTSPIPSHPSTAILDETISNIRKYTDAKIIIMFDGIHHSLELRKPDYMEYLHRVSVKIEGKDYGDCGIIVFNEHTHQSAMTKTVLQYEVETPLIMFCEHDTSPIGDIPFQQLCDFVQHDEQINYLRFNIFEQTPQEHSYLMLSKKPVIKNGVSMVRTIQFSARPHIAKADWYLKILKDCFGIGEKMMIEDRMHSIVQESYKELKKDVFGLAIYAPEGSQLRSYHSDGRGADEKIIEA